MTIHQIRIVQAVSEAIHEGHDDWIGIFSNHGDDLARSRFNEFTKKDHTPHEFRLLCDCGYTPVQAIAALDK